MYKSYHFDRIDSTSSFLKRNYEKYENFTFISTDFQESGHGRMNRTWISNDKENLLFSLLIKDKNLFKKYDKLSLASAVSIMLVLKELGIENVTIKWPNDVFVNDKKICGILLESVSFGDSIEALILGVGININTKSFEGNYLNYPTSIYLELQKDIDVKEFKIKVYEKLMEIIKSILNEDEYYLELLKDNNYLKNKECYAIYNGRKILVKVIDINDDNSLKVMIENKLLDIHSGEITFHK